MAGFTVGAIIVDLVRGDITGIQADVIVNAANSWLKHGGGVALAISRKGGRLIQEESDRYVASKGPVPVGQVGVTGAGQLKAKFVVHAVGPVYGEPDHAAKLESAYRNALVKAEELGAYSIALPAISTGAYGYPLKECAKILADVILRFSSESRKLGHVIVCLYNDESYRVFMEVFGETL